MTPSFPMPVPGQRAAEEFDSVLSGRASLAVAERHADLVAAVTMLRDQPAVMPRADFVADLRERLLLAAESEMVPAAPVVRRLPASRPQRRRRLATAAAALVMVGGTAGMAAAAEGAMPGESLYPIKRGVEQVTIAAHLSDSSKGAALLDQAGERLDEVETLVAEGKGDSALLDETVSDFRSSADAGADKLFTAYQTSGDTTDVTTVRTFAADAMSQISGLTAGADTSLVAGLRELADTLADIDQQAAVLCASCGGDPLTPPDALARGAGALAVQSLIARPASQMSLDLAKAKALRDAADEAELDDLKNAAQGEADSLGTTKKGGSAVSDGVTETLTGTVDATGKLVPAVTKTAGGAVKGLVGNVTGAVGGGGGGGDGGLSGTLTDTGNAVDDTVDGVTGTVDDLTEDLLGGTKKND